MTTVSVRVSGQIKAKDNSKFKNEHKPGVFTNSKPLLDKDKEIIKKVLKGVQLKRPVEVQAALLRRYLLELTNLHNPSGKVSRKSAASCKDNFTLQSSA